MEKALSSEERKKAHAENNRLQAIAILEWLAQNQDPVKPEEEKP